MLVVRIFLGFIGIALILSLLGYAINRDRRWFRFIGLLLKIGVAFVLLMMLALLLERLLMII
jgi:uncharacterized membrane protein